MTDGSAAAGDGIAVVTGLFRALADELLLFASGVRGRVFDLEPERMGVVLLGPSSQVSVGEDVHRSHTVVSVPVGASLLGRTIDALGQVQSGEMMKRSIIMIAGDEVAGNLRVTLSQFEELEEFARFGTRLDDATRNRLSRGAAVRAALRQAEHHPIPADEQLAVLVCALQGLFDELDEPAIKSTLQAIQHTTRHDMS